MTDDQDLREQQYIDLVGRMLVTLEVADRLLEGYQPKDEKGRHQLEWTRESIKRCYVAAEELFPSEEALK